LGEYNIYEIIFFNKNKMAKVGRPSKIKKEHIIYLNEYLKTCKEEYEQLIKSESNKWTSYENKLKVELPTYAWYLYFLSEKDIYLMVEKSTLDDWKNKWLKILEEKEEENYDDLDKIFIEFYYSLNKLLKLQERMLLNWWVSNQYWQVITKLMLSSNHWYAEKMEVENKHSWKIDFDVSEEQKRKIAERILKNK